ncbi:MAG: arsenate reductase [Cohaesibacteraceae bacterium]|nr:arsenate reductase [Cohaesibacteraceae bacterium]
MKLYGLKNCDTCRKARKSIEQSGREVEFVDVRDTPLDTETLDVFLSRFSEKVLLNRRSTTWRSLSGTERAGDPVKLLQKYPSLMKRPVIDTGYEQHIGWTPEVQAVIGK